MRIGYGISVAGSNQRNLVSAQAEQVIWKVAIFGAGTASSNGEYVWDGTTTFNGENVYSGPADNQIAFVDGLWYLYDSSGGDDTYTSENLIAWDILAGLSPAPSSAFSYAQDSFISSITISYPDLSLMDGAYSRASGGATTLYDGSNYNYINYSAGTWYLWSEDIADNVGNSLDLVKWNANAGFQDPVNVTAVSYSA